MDTQALTLDHLRDFSFYGSVGQVAKPQRSTSLSLTSILRQTSTMILAGGQGDRYQVAVDIHSHLNTTVAELVSQVGEGLTVLE